MHERVQSGLEFAENSPSDWTNECIESTPTTMEKKVQLLCTRFEPFKTILAAQVNQSTYLCLVPERHDAGHLLLGDLDLPPAVRRLLDATHAKVLRTLRVLLRLLTRRHSLLVRATPWKK